jgi:cobalamin biosynthesis protein CbiG
MTIPCIVNDWTGRFDHAVEVVSEAQARAYYKDQPKSIQVDPRNGYFESFDDDRVAYHMSSEWTEDQVMPLRAPMWIGILSRHGYHIERLSSRVREVLQSAGIDYPETPVKK